MSALMKMHLNSTCTSCLGVLFEYTSEGTGKGGVVRWERYPFYEPRVNVLEIWKKVGGTKDRSGQMGKGKVAGNYLDG
jgi:hypothetical protein